MGRGVKVRKERAESRRQDLLASGVLDTSKKPVETPDHIIFPVRDTYDGSTVSARFESFATTKSFREAAEDILTEEEKAHFIHSYDTVGSIAIIQIPSELSSKKELLAEALLTSQPSIKTVRCRATERTGVERLRTTEFLAGEQTTRTVHVEHGVELVVDVNHVYFSPRLSTERGRIAETVENGESVLVMFSGCAPYPCIIASKNDESTIVGVEINQAGHELGVANIHRNNFDDRVDLYHGDVKDVVPKLGVFDRVVMPAPYNASSYLDIGRDALRSEGTLHLYDFVSESENPSFDDFNTIKTVVCGDRSPSEQRVCFDLVLSEHR